MSGGFPFSLYMEELLRLADNSLCRSSEKNLGNELCYIKKNKWSNSSRGWWNSWNLDEIEDRGVLPVFQASAKICKIIEEWSSRLTRGDEGSVVFEERSGCDISSLGLALRGGSNTGRCPTEPIGLEWLKSDEDGNISSNTVSQKRMKVCQAIVQIMIREYGMSLPKGGIGEGFTEGENRCQGVYEQLKRWGGINVAEHIMNNWYTVESTLQVSEQKYKITGKDLFELVQEAVWGTDKGEKMLGCKKCLPGNRWTKGQEPVWCEELLSSGVSGGPQAHHLASFPVATEDTLTSGGQEVFKETREDEQTTLAVGGRPRGDQKGELPTGAELGGRGVGGQTSIDRVAPIIEEDEAGVSYSGMLGAGISLILAIVGSYGLFRIFNTRSRRRGGAKGANYRGALMYRAMPT
ncbi:hypothetical protein C922_05740 [Plasmodium inui San Antonio 1]|uniref:Uncharacterized protein n=1 Tax=Plasmodium inui San Antonio 1 TaxID=1237626 RepID=W6ZX93_9APIC|nr:hypothetical protein C922_05740 [Plasmodium inui San Antonio 1]EUD63880.1 hypothetical protein C922_05740 [Plasmodium inui San Antonio 1]